jgi:hypothetical protein
MNNQDPSRYTYPHLEERFLRYKQNIHHLSDQALARRYIEEALKLRALNQFGRHSQQFKGYPNTHTINLCRRVLVQRNYPIPSSAELQALLYQELRRSPALIISGNAE